MSRPCANGCPFYGTPQTDNLCSACFRLANANSTCSNSKCPKGAAAASSSAAAAASNLAAAVASSSSAVVATPPPPPTPITTTTTTTTTSSGQPVGVVTPVPLSTTTTSTVPTSNNMQASSSFVQQQQQQTRSTFEHIPKPLPSSQQPPASPVGLASPNTAAQSTAQATASPDDARPAPPPSNRCFQCRKKLGLTPFVCRCNRSFCPKHRLSTAHNCEFDYKAQQRDILSRSNPAVLAKKVDKI